MALSQPQFLELQSTEPDFRELRAQLLALYRQCEDDVACATEMQSDYRERIRQANAMRRNAANRMAKVRALLDIQFPGWND
jgi:hypothetical protein